MVRCDTHACMASKCVEQSRAEQRLPYLSSVGWLFVCYYAAVHLYVYQTLLNERTIMRYCCSSVDDPQKQQGWMCIIIDRSIDLCQ